MLKLKQSQIGIYEGSWNSYVVYETCTQTLVDDYNSE